MVDRNKRIMLYYKVHTVGVNHLSVYRKQTKTRIKPVSERTMIPNVDERNHFEETGDSAAFAELQTEYRKLRAAGVAAQRQLSD